MNISRIIIADNQPLTALAVETLCKRLTTNGHNQEAEIVYATNKYELGVLLKQRVNCAVIIDYTLFNFDNQDNFAMMCDLYQETSSWLLLSDELTADFLRFVLYQTTNVSVSYKDSPIDIIREALRFVLRGERYIAQHAMNILLLSETEQPHVNTDLTQTELEILKAMTQGKLTKEIAYERGSSIHTINSHRKNIFRKLNVNCAHDAIKYALRAGLVDQAEFYI
jgi:DNA-binding NarL/FixJ family response regulator